MKYVSAKYEAQLDALAESLKSSHAPYLGQLSLLDQPPLPPEGAVILPFPLAQVIELPRGNRELGAE